jgi:hypothetical protein
VSGTALAPVSHEIPVASAMPLTRSANVYKYEPFQVDFSRLLCSRRVLANNSRWTAPRAMPFRMTKWADMPRASAIIKAKMNEEVK